MRPPGIVGYVGLKPVLDVLIPGLAHLEYRGYDSAGVALNRGDSLEVIKKAGRIADLENALANVVPEGVISGIGHTRWATHGAPNTINAHPQVDSSGDVVVVHNGIVENWVQLKKSLVESGRDFVSDTDTEVLAHLIGDLHDVPLVEAVRQVMNKAKGALALAVMRSSEPDVIVGARRGSPLVVGRGDNENFLASDIPAFLEHTREMVIVDDDRVVELRRDSVRIVDLDGNDVELEHRKVDWDLESSREGWVPDIHAQRDLRAAPCDQRHLGGSDHHGRQSGAQRVRDRRSSVEGSRQGLCDCVWHLVSCSDDGQICH